MEILNWISMTIALGWMYSAFFIFLGRYYGLNIPFLSMMLTIYRVLKPMYWPSAAFNVMYMILYQDYGTLRIVIDSILYITGWWIYKDEDKDDWWKRQAEKALGVVKSIGHRLIVVPT